MNNNPFFCLPRLRFLLPCLLFSLLILTTSGHAYVVNNIATQGAPSYGLPDKGLAIDSSGNRYFQDQNCSIIRMQADGTVTLDIPYTGGSCSVSDIAVDHAGNIIVSKSVNSSIEKIHKYSSTGTPLGSWGTIGTGDGEFDYVNGLAVDASNNIYVVDSYNNRIQKFDPSGNFIDTFGTVGSGPGELQTPMGIEIDGSGNIYVSEYDGYRVNKFDSSYTYLYSLAMGSQLGGLTLGANGHIYVFSLGDFSIHELTDSGSALTDIADWTFAANLRYQDIAADSSNNTFLINTGGIGNAPASILEFNSGGVYQGFSTPILDSNGFNYISSIASDSSGNIYIADAGYNRIQKYSSSGAYVSTLGGFAAYGNTDGKFQSPISVAVDDSDNIYVADQNRNDIQKFNSAGVYQFTIGSAGSGDGELDYPYGMVVSSDGNLYVADSQNQRVVIFNSVDGAFISHFGTNGSGPGEFFWPSDVALDSTGKVYVTDSYRNDVQQFSHSGSYLNGWGSFGAGPGEFDTPDGIAIDAYDNIYVFDDYNCRVEKFDLLGSYLGEVGSCGDASGELYGNGEYNDLVVTSDGNILIVDSGNTRVQTLKIANQISGITSGLGVVDATTGNSIASGSADGIFDVAAAVRIVSATGKPIAEVATNLTVDRTWDNSIAGETDLGAKKAYIANLNPGTALGAASTHILYIPRDLAETQVKICPSATDLSGTTLACGGGVIFIAGQTQAIGADTVTVTITTIDGQSYWQAAGVSGTGGISIPISAAYNFELKDVMSRLQVSTLSDHEIHFGTVNGLLLPTDTIVLAFDNVGQNFNLGSLAVSDIDLLDDNTSLTLAAAPGVSTVGVVINNTADTITFTAPTSGTYIDAGSVLIVKIGTNVTGGVNQIGNPAGVGIYFVTPIVTNVLGTEGGDVAVPIVDSDQVNVTGYINTFIHFDIDTNTDGSDCAYNTCQLYEGAGAAANYTVDLGELNSVWVNKSQDNIVTHSDGNTGEINSIYLDLTTNAYSGAIVSVYSLNGALQGPAANTIDSVTDGQTIASNSKLYGFTLPTAGTGNGNITRNTNCNDGSTYCALATLALGGNTVFNTGGAPLDIGRLRMDLAASASVISNPGIYTDTLTFVATATF